MQLSDNRYLISKAMKTSYNSIYKFIESLRHKNIGYLFDFCNKNNITVAKLWSKESIIDTIDDVLMSRF